MGTRGLADPWEPGVGLAFQAPPARQKVPVLGGGRDEVSTAAGQALGGWVGQQIKLVHLTYFC